MRRFAMFALLMLAVVPLAGVSAAGASPRVELKVATIAPDGTALVEGLREASREMLEKTGGRVGLKIYPGGVMGTDAVVLRKVRTGQLHGGTFVSGGLADVYGDYMVLGMPMLLKDYAQVDRAREKYEPMLTEELEKRGFVSFGMIESGFIYLMSNKPIARLADLKGLKVWVPEGDDISRKVFEEAGVQPIPLPIPDVLTGLQTNLLDTVPSSPSAAIILQWFTRVKYLTEVPLLYAYGTFAIAGKWWDRIPEQDRPVVREVLTRAVKEVDRRNRRDNKEALETLRKQGISFVPVGPDAVAGLEEVCRKALETFRGKGLFDLDLLEQVRRAVEQGR